MINIVTHCTGWRVSRARGAILQPCRARRRAQVRQHTAVVGGTGVAGGRSRRAATGVGANMRSPCTQAAKASSQAPQAGNDAASTSSHKSARPHGRSVKWAAGVAAGAALGSTGQPVASLAEQVLRPGAQSDPISAAKQLQAFLGSYVNQYGPETDARIAAAVSKLQDYIDTRTGVNEAATLAAAADAPGPGDAQQYTNFILDGLNGVLDWVTGLLFRDGPKPYIFDAAGRVIAEPSADAVARQQEQLREAADALRALVAQLQQARTRARSAATRTPRRTRAPPRSASPALALRHNPAPCLPVPAHNLPPGCLAAWPARPPQPVSLPPAHLPGLAPVFAPRGARRARVAGQPGGAADGHGRPTGLRRQPPAHAAAAGRSCGRRRSAAVALHTSRAGPPFGPAPSPPAPSSLAPPPTRCPVPRQARPLSSPCLTPGP
jgi:hypothetical protein